MRSPPASLLWTGVAVVSAIAFTPAESAAAGSSAPALVEVAVGEGADGFDAVAAHPSDPGLLWAAAGSRVLESADGGRSWRARFRLPGAGLRGRGAAGSEAAVVDGQPVIEAELEFDELAQDEIDDAPAGATEAEWRSPELAGDVRSRIHRLRAGPGALWVAADDALYRWSGSGAGSLDRFRVPGGASVLAVAPDPLRPEAAWLATDRGLARVDGALVTRAPGAVGSTSARDVDAIDRERVAVATDRGLFLSADGGRTFTGPLAIASAGDPLVAVRLAGDGGVAVAANGSLVRFDREGRFEVLAERGFPGARHLHLGEDGSIWIASANGLFLFAGGGPALPVTRGLPTDDIRDAITPAGRPDRPLVAADRALFLAGDQLLPVPAAAWIRPGAAASLQGLVRAAGQHLGLPRIESDRRITLSSLLPDLEASWSRRDTANAGRRGDWVALVRWDLVRLLEPAGLAISPMERRLVKARRAVALRVERALVALDRLAGAWRSAGGAVETALAFLAADEQEARLDGLTGGFHRSPPNVAEIGKRGSEW